MDSSVASLKPSMIFLCTPKNFNDLCSIASLVQMTKSSMLSNMWQVHNDAANSCLIDSGAVAGERLNITLHTFLFAVTDFSGLSPHRHSWIAGLAPAGEEWAGFSFCYLLPLPGSKCVFFFFFFLLRIQCKWACLPPYIPHEVTCVACFCVCEEKKKNGIHGSSDE